LFGIDRLDLQDRIPLETVADTTVKTTLLKFKKRYPTMFTTSIKDTFSFFKAHWWVLALISMPLALFSEVIKYWLGPIHLDDISRSVFLVYLAEIILVMSLTQIAVILYVDAAVNGSRMSVLDSWTKGVKWLLPFLGLGMLTMVPVVLGLILLIIPGVIVMVRLMLAPYIFLLEGLGAKASLTASWERTKGHFGDLVIGAIVIMLPIILLSRFFADSDEMLTSSIKVAMVASIETFFGLLLSVYVYRIYCLIKVKQ
jgi:hypothetical protein